MIVDSKVSLTAYVNYMGSDDPEEQKVYLRDHLRSVRKHIDDLSRKEYHEYAQTLDFVMLFIPNEPAYLLALQHEEVCGSMHTTKNTHDEPHQPDRGTETDIGSVETRIPKPARAGDSR